MIDEADESFVPTRKKEKKRKREEKKRKDNRKGKIIQFPSTNGFSFCTRGLLQAFFCFSTRSRFDMKFFKEILGFETFDATPNEFYFKKIWIERLFGEGIQKYVRVHSKTQASYLVMKTYFTISILL
jgi:hypothetical protein